MNLCLPLIAMFAVVSTACGKSEHASDKPAASASGKPEEKPADKPKASVPPPAEAKVEMVEVDLSSAGAAWKGYSIKAPKESQVMEDMSNIRVAGKGCPITETCPQFDLILSQKKPNFKETKSLQDQGATAMKDKIEWTSETADTLEWTRESSMGDSTIKTLNFERIVKVGGKELGCWPLNAPSKESDIAAMKEACTTLSKK
jgi:hypothetical protein